MLESQFEEISVPLDENVDDTAELVKSLEQIEGKGNADLSLAE